MYERKLNSTRTERQINGNTVDQQIFTEIVCKSGENYIIKINVCILIFNQ